jgi:hypothetical protein
MRLSSPWMAITSQTVSDSTGAKPMRSRAGHRPRPGVRHQHQGLQPPGGHQGLQGPAALRPGRQGGQQIAATVKTVASVVEAAGVGG